MSLVGACLQALKACKPCSGTNLRLYTGLPSWVLVIHFQMGDQVTFPECSVMHLSIIASSHSLLCRLLSNSGIFY